MSRFTVTARVYENGHVRLISVSGQTARALVALVEAGNDGRTAAEVSNWAYRFSAYCHELRHRYGLEIRTDRETHPFGWHGRHVLVTPVEIVSADEMEAAA
jgi:hypothetical protein